MRTLEHHEIHVIFGGILSQRTKTIKDKKDDDEKGFWANIIDNCSLELDFDSDSKAFKFTFVFGCTF
jgi:hypothetical protein